MPMNSNDTIIFWNSVWDKTYPFDHKTRKYPMEHLLHIGMQKNLWQRVMAQNNVYFHKEYSKFINKYETNIDFGRHVEETIINEFGKDAFRENDRFDRGDNFWFLDQKLISIRIKDYNEKYSNQLIYERPFYYGFRLDRSYFHKIGKYLPLKILLKFAITDFHSFHDNVFEYWGLMQNVIDNLFSDNYYLSLLFDNYFSQYVEIREFIKDKFKINFIKV